MDKNDAEEVVSIGITYDNTRLSNARSTEDGSVILHPQPSNDPNDPLVRNQFSCCLYEPLLDVQMLIILCILELVSFQENMQFPHSQLLHFYDIHIVSILCEILERMATTMDLS